MITFGYHITMARESQGRAAEAFALEAGATAAFEPARQLYEKFGFDYCGPFGEYADDPNSTFMTKQLY